MEQVQEQVRGKSLVKQLVLLASPMIFSNLAYTLLGAVDTIFLGRVSTTSLGAVGIAGMMYLTLSLLFRGVVNGVTPFVARRFGASDYDGAGVYLKHFLLLAVFITPFLLFLPWVFQFLFHLMRPDPQVAEEAMIYISIRLWELPVSMLMTAMTGFMVGVGNSRLPMLLAWFSVVLNIGANYVLIFGHLGFPAMGIAGAAYGTVFAVLCQTLLAGFLVLRTYAASYGLTTWSFPSLSQIGNMLKVGFPIGVADAVEVGAFTAFFAFISRLGTVELAASQIVNQVAAVAFMPGFALSAATGSLVGRYLGAKRPDISSRIGFLGAIIGSSAMGILGIGFFLFARQLGLVFTKDPAVLALTRTLLQVVAFYQALDGFNIVFRGALNGAGDTRFTMVFTILAAWICFVPGVYLAVEVLHLGLIGAWLTAIAYIGLLGVSFGVRFSKGRWKTISLA